MSQSAPWTAQASVKLADAPHPHLVDDSPVAGRVYHGLSYAPTHPSAGSPQPSPSLRSPRAPGPSPLSFGKPTSTPSSPSNLQRPFRPIDERTRPSEPDAADQTTFYTDSSAAPSPEPSSPKSRGEPQTNAIRSVSEPLTSKGDGSPKPPRLPMAGPAAVAQGEVAQGLPRNSSIDSAISAMSSQSHPRKASSDGSGSPDIGNLIKTAGSAEAVIQYLLKEKHSQSQQNSQLWRLVDKQRAMILGLNKDLERALKDKEKYRTKLKEVVATATAPKPAGNTTQAQSARDAPLPRVDVHSPKTQSAFGPGSPVLDSDSQKASPIHMAMAPYPITPPADHAAPPPSAVREALDPAHAMPKPQEHALGKYDHEEIDRVEDEERKARADEDLETIPFNVGLPPSRSLPSEPPNMPPPKPPVSHPTLSIVEATPEPNEGLAQFPAPPPRKPPPAPLQLKKDLRPDLGTPPQDEESDSDYDDLLEVEHIMTEKRGRRRTRAEDDREREIQAYKEAEARSASKKSKSSKPNSPEEELPQDPMDLESEQRSGTTAASLDAVMHGNKTITRELIAPPVANAGLPASPRPMGAKNMTSPPLSPRGPSNTITAGPLSPRPPRQPIPLPPNTPLATPATHSTGDSLKSPKPLNITKRNADDGQPQSATTNLSSPTERTKVYTGLVTDDYPELLLPPNALPSIEVRVASSRMKPSRASMMSLTQLEEDPVFTLAIISRADRGELWRVEKDTASLGKLDARVKQCPTFTAKAPDRSLFSGHSPAKLDARRVALEHYMDELLNTPLDTPTALELCKYLSTNTLPPNADETGSVDSSVNEGSMHKIGPEGLPYRNGYLTKKGKNFGGWKARFFVLDGPHLKYYETPGGAHLGTIKLPRAQIGKQSQSQDNHSPSQSSNADDLDNQYRHAFLVLEPKKKDSNSHVKHVLCAESDKERDLWVDALLQWIDFRDPDDEGPAPRSHPHERQATLTKAKKTPHGKQQQHQQNDSDALIGVRYDSTNAGETPQGAPGRNKNNGGHAEPLRTPQFAETMTSQPKMISGPKDGQVISDTAAWGNKASGLGIPNNEEKKARKRSFFGFGPKARSSSDGQESLFGSDAGATPPQNAYHGPVRQAFGAPLAEAVRFNPPSDTNVPLPAVVFRCIQYLDAKNAVLEEGIFRLSGSNLVIKQLRERFNQEGDINLLSDDQFYDMHAIASLLKLYLRELPTTILTRDLHLDFVATTEMTNKNEKLAAMNELVQRLPQANATLLKYLIAFLIKIINNADVNKMTVRNVGIVFSPTLNIPAPVFALFLQNYEAIFGIDADEYELPSPVSEPEGHGRADPPTRFEPPPVRPSTSSGSASPQRQPRMESMQHYQRSTPTPPLTGFHQGARGSPGSGPRQMYDTGYLAQQGGAPPGRSGYESNVSYDPRANPSQTYTAGYEESSGHHAPYEQSYGGGNGSGNSNSKRRESAVFMGGMVGLQHQGSRSRLREETRF
ncbi:rhoGAP domain-containing protein [Sarocladium implicatum]|nr:rhoGAP domain-containing protein [Sarocladium implicatum]